MARSTRQAVATDRLDDMLTRLKLPGLRDQLDTLLDEATRHDLSMRETLALLCEREIARKDQRRIEMGLKVAHFPYVRELTSFDFAAQPSVDAKQVRDLAAARWVANGENVLLLGPPGVGKTHLAIALGRAAITAGHSVLFVTAIALVASLAKGHAQGHLEERLITYIKPKLLIIDELGYLPLEPDAAHLFFQLVSRRKWGRATEERVMTDKATIEARVPRKGLQSGVLREYTIVGKVKPGHEKAVRDALTAHLTDPRRADVEVLKKVGIHTALHALFDNDTRLVATVWFENDFDRYFDDVMTIIGVDLYELWLRHLEGFPEKGLLGGLSGQAGLEFGKNSSFPPGTIAEQEKTQRLVKAFQKVLDHPDAKQALKHPALKPLLDEAAD